MHTVLIIVLCWISVSLGTTVIWTCYCLWPRRREALRYRVKPEPMQRI